MTQHVTSATNLGQSKVIQDLALHVGIKVLVELGLGWLHLFGFGYLFTIGLPLASDDLATRKAPHWNDHCIGCYTMFVFKSCLINF